MGIEKVFFCDVMPSTLFFLLLNWLSFRFDSDMNIRDIVDVGAVECHFSHVLYIL